MPVSRRTALLRCALVAAVPLGLAACSTLGSNPLGKTITVNLSGAQAEASAILAALNIVAGSAALSMSTAMQKTITGYLADLDAAVSAFAALGSGSTTIAAFAGTVIKAVSKVVGLLPLPPATQLAINEGLSLLAALVAGLSSITVTPVAAPVAAVPGRIAAPIPIPVG